jgi:hypothetical protein
MTRSFSRHQRSFLDPLKTFHKNVITRKSSTGHLIEKVAHFDFGIMMLRKYRSERSEGT